MEQRTKTVKQLLQDLVEAEKELEKAKQKVEGIRQALNVKVAQEKAAGAKGELLEDESSVDLP